jgi:heat shock protein HslJ
MGGEGARVVEETHGVVDVGSGRMQRRLVGLMVVALVVGFGLAGCGDGGPDIATGGGPGSGDEDDDNGPRAAGDLPADLEGRRFVSESVTEGGEERPLVDDTEITLEFLDDGVLTAFAGCNQLRGPVTAESGRLVVSDLPITDMACSPPSLHDQDQWLAEFLLAGPTYTLDAPALTLRVDGTVVELIDTGVASGGADGAAGDGQDPDEPVASESPLVGTSWRLTTIIDGDSAGSMPDGVAATITFEAESVGFTVEGCNTGGADAEITASQVALTEPLIMTMMLCEGPASVVESAVVAVLDGEIGYVIDRASDGDTLTLTLPDGMSLALSRDE